MNVQKSGSTSFWRQPGSDTVYLLKTNLKHSGTTTEGWPRAWNDWLDRALESGIAPSLLRKEPGPATGSILATVATRSTPA